MELAGGWARGSRGVPEILDEDPACPPFGRRGCDPILGAISGSTLNSFRSLSGELLGLESPRKISMEKCICPANKGGTHASSFDISAATQFASVAMSRQLKAIR